MLQVLVEVNADNIAVVVSIPYGVLVIVAILKRSYAQWQLLFDFLRDNKALLVTYSHQLLFKVLK